MKGFVVTRAKIKEDSTDLISFFIQDNKKMVMYYHLANQAIIGMEDDPQNYAIANQSTFTIHPLKVKMLVNFRQSDGFYVHQEKGMLIKKKFDLDLNGYFELVNERDLKNFPVSVGDYVHIKDLNGNYLGVNKNIIRSTYPKPDLNTRFFIEDRGTYVTINYEGIGNKGQLITQLDGTIRLSYYNELNDPRTQFIIGNSYKMIS
jgi:hypothetical protein